MRPYNVEIYDRDFTVVHHTNINEISYSEDYLSPDWNKITIAANNNVAVNQYIRIKRGSEDYFGIVGEIEQGTQDKKLTSITVYPISSLFDAEVVFDTDLQGSAIALETMLKNLIDAYFVNNADTLQNISGLNVVTTSTTYGWGFNIKSDVENMHTAVINLYDVLIVRSLKKYGVRIKLIPDPQTRVLTLEIGKESGTKVIEADLPNIIKKSIVVGTTGTSTNKLIVHNSQNYSQSIIYYLHTDLSYDTTDDDRITPVVYDIDVTEPTESKTFAQQAAEVASNVFSGAEYNNLIELTMTNDDVMVVPADIEIGQEISVISNGNTYKSILTGRKVSDTTTLIFGLIRQDFTKKLKTSRR